MRVLGIDPGSLVTGFGLVDGTGEQLRHVVHGTVRPRRGATLAARLATLHDEMLRVAVDHTPDVAVVEQVFVAASPRSALVLGQARGAILAAVGRAGLSVHELAPREVKKAVVGTGSATKAQVQAMVADLLQLERRPASDAAEALACAICHANGSRLAALGVGRRSRRRSRRPASVLQVRTGRRQ